MCKLLRNFRFSIGHPRRVVRRSPQAAQALDGGHEVVGAGQRLSIAGERVARAVDEARHAVEHSESRFCSALNPTNIGAMVLDGSVGHVAAKDVAELILIGAGDVRVRRLVFEFGAVGLGASHDVLLAARPAELPTRTTLCFHFCSNSTEPAAPGTPSGRSASVGSVEQGWILRAIDEAGEIAIVPVRPARGFFGQRGLAREVMNDGAGHVEDDVVRAAGEPYQRVMLRGRHNEIFYALDRFVEALHAGGGVLGNNFAPELRAKADDEVHASGGGSWLADGGDGGGELLAFVRVENVELEVRMRGGSESEDSSLRRVHAGIISGVIWANTTEDELSLREGKCGDFSSSLEAIFLSAILLCS